MLKGKASWAYLTKANEKWEQPRYEITLDVDANTYNAFDEEVDFGATYAKGKYTIKLNCPAKKADGTDAPKPLFVDQNASPTNVLLGNGSEVYVKYRTFKYTRGRSEGKTRAYLEGVQIVNLVPYEAEDNEDGADAPTSVGFEPLTPESPHD